jgi:hypothetical protein
MPVERTLEAVMTARESVTGALDDIESGALAAASAFETAGQAADAFGHDLDDAEDAAGALDRELTAVSAGAANAATALGLAQTRADELGDEFTETAAEGGLLAGVLAGMPAAGILGGAGETSVRADIHDASFLAVGARLDTLTRDRTVGISTDTEGFAGLGPLGDRSIPIRASINQASFAAARAAIAGLPDSHTVEVLANVDRDSFSIPQLAGGTVPFAAGGVATPDVSPDARTIPFEAGSVSMPSLSPDIEALDFEAALPDGGIADALPNLTDQSVSVDVGGTEQLAAVQAAGHLAAEGLDEASRAALEASTTNALAASAADEAGDGFVSMVPGGSAAASALDSVRSSAFGAVPGLTAAGSAADEYGDEASEAAAETAVLQASMASLGGTGLGAELFGIHGGLSSLAAILPGVIALAGGLVAPLGAITVGALGAGGALSAMLAGGLLSQGEALVGTLQQTEDGLKRVETAGQGVEIVLGNIKDRAADIFSGLQTGQTSQFFSGLVESGLTVLEDFVGLTNRLMEPILAMSDRIGDAFAIEEPRFFAELEATTRALLPALESFAVWMLGAVPDALAWVREEGVPLIPLFADLGDAVLSALVEFAELGGVIWNVLGPGLSWLFNTTAGVLDAFNDLPGPVKTFAAVGTLAAGAFYLLAGGAVAASGATTVLGAVSAAALAPVGALAAAVGVLTSPLFLAALAIGAVVGAGALLISHFGLMDDLVSGLTGTWNALVGGLEWAANAFLNLYDMAKPILMLIPGVGQLVWLFDNWRAVVDVLGDALAWVVGKAQDLVKWLDELSGFDEFVGKFIGQADDRREGQAQVDLSGFKAGQGGTAAQDGRGGGGGPGGPQGPQQPPGPGAGAYGGGYGTGYGGGQAGGAAATAGGGTTVENTVNYYEQNGDAKSGPARERRVRSIVRQMNDETRRSGTGMN